MKTRIPNCLLDLQTQGIICAINELGRQDQGCLPTRGDFVEFPMHVNIIMDTNYRGPPLVHSVLDQVCFLARCYDKLGPLNNIIILKAKRVGHVIVH